MPYCTPDDLLLGDIIVSPDSPLDVWVTRAAEEMHSKLGYRYTIPIVPRMGLGGLSLVDTLTLKDINVKLASGRWLASQSQESEQSSVHAYARWLLNDALQMLNRLANGDLPLDSAELAENIQEEGSTLPGIINHDEVSLVDVWEDNVMRDTPYSGRPGRL